MDPKLIAGRLDALGPGLGREGRGRLSSRESAVLAVLRSGLTVKEIAARLHISHSTVGYHVANIYRKLGAHNRQEALNSFDALEATAPDEGLMSAVLFGARLASEIVSPREGGGRAAYFRLVGEDVAPVIELDQAEQKGRSGFALAEHHFFYDIVSSGKPRSGVLRRNLLGPQVRRIAAATGVSAGGGVPIYLGSSIHGILAIGSRTGELSRGVFEHLVDLGRLVQLAVPRPAANGQWIGTTSSVR